MKSYYLLSCSIQYLIICLVLYTEFTFYPNSVTILYMGIHFKLLKLIHSLAKRKLIEKELCVEYYKDNHYKSDI